MEPPEKSGRFITNLVNAGTPAHEAMRSRATGTFLTSWGSARPGGEFFSPTGVATDGSGHVYVADTQNHRIQKFDASGTFLTKWGSGGSGNGQFIEPFGVATDGSGHVYVADYNNNNAPNNHRIQKFDASGTFLTSWGRDRKSTRLNSSH